MRHNIALKYKIEARYASLDFSVGQMAPETPNTFFRNLEYRDFAYNALYLYLYGAPLKKAGLRS